VTAVQDFSAAENDLIYVVTVADLAVLLSRIWSYAWRVGHLRDALGPGKQAIHARIAERDSTPESLSYFSRKFQGQLQDTMQAGIIVLIHSLADGVLNSLLATCIQNEPVRWRREIIKAWKKDYSLEEALSLDQAGVLEKATSHFVRQLGHKSLKEKNALLLNVVSSRAKTQDDSISRSENLIIQFDRARHEIVHEDGLAHGNYSTIYQDLDRVIRRENRIGLPEHKTENPT
jgi:hypothetical protein